MPPQTGSEEEGEQKAPEPYLTRLYEATKAGYIEFKKELMIAHHAGYEYRNAVNIGKAHFMVVFKLTKEEHEYADFAGLDDFGRETF